jgi:phthiocerol/phenolphthiocerol synthesis type-I polyketide synthase B
MSQLAGTGAVALLEADAGATETLIAGYPGVEIAGYLSPRQTVVAGPVPEIEALLAAATASNRFARRVNMEVASHTALMDPVCEPLQAELADLVPRVPGIAMLSTVVPLAETSTAPVLDADYWVSNVRRPVRFHQAVAAAGADHGTFIEISPNPILTHSIDDTLADVHHHALPTLVRDADDTCTFHTSLNATHTTHPPVTPHAPEPHIALPATPWRHGTHWVPETVRRPSRERAAYGGGALASVVPADWVCEMHWPASPLAMDSAGGAGEGWLVIADGAIGAEIGRRLAGDAVVTVASPSELADDPDAVLAELAGVTHVLYAPEAPGAGVWDPATGRRIFAAARRLAGAMAARPRPATEPIPPTRCCGAWAARWPSNTPRSGAGSSMSTNRFPPNRPRPGFSARRGPGDRRTRSSTGPGCDGSRGCGRAPRRRRPGRSGWTPGAATWSSVRPATSGRTSSDTSPGRAPPPSSPCRETPAPASTGWPKPCRNGESGW